MTDNGCVTRRAAMQFRIRPIYGGPWLYCGSFDEMAVMFEEVGDAYEVERVALSEEQLAQLPEFEGF